MLSKKEIKDIQSLRYKKERDEAGLFLAEGPKVVGELLEIMPQQAIRIFALASWVNELPDKKALMHTIVTEIELGKLSGLQTPNQVVAVFKQPSSLAPILSPNDFCLYLGAIQDPGNLGTIIRIADWFNIKNIVCTEGCADVYQPKVIQSSMASIGRVSFWWDKEMEWLKKQSATIYAATLGGQSVYTIPKNKGGILLIGNESKGLGKSYLKIAHQAITIPRLGAAESLNAAVATGIILSHLTN